MEGGRKLRAQFPLGISPPRCLDLQSYVHVPPAEVATLLTNRPQVAVPQVGAPRVSISWGLNLRARAGRGAARTLESGVWEEADGTGWLRRLGLKSPARLRGSVLYSRP